MQEADAGEWYHLNDEKRNVKISEDGEIVMLDFKNKNKTAESQYNQVMQK